ncbi:MAG: SDR family NAD(P)-dependent oxidoreductase [Porticoccaceae bacterium]
MNRLQDKVALITGGCSGFGAATAALFVAQGARVVVADLQAQAGAEQEARFPGKLRFVQCDVTSEEQLRNAVQTAVDSFGGLDILFNNAGGNDPEHLTIAEMDETVWDWTLALNLRAAVMGMKHALPALRVRGGGAVINTASIAGMGVGISTVAYSVAKAGLIHLTRMAAAEFAPHGIRVNAICPGTIPTPAYEREFGLARGTFDNHRQDIDAIFQDAQPLRQAGQVDDVARMALFLASDDARFVTGQHMVVDGGMLQMPPPSLRPEDPQAVLPRMVNLAQRLGGGT